MILTVKEGYNRQEGRDLQMFSRSGKSTIAQHLQFTQHRPNESKQQALGSDNEEDDHHGDGQKLDPVQVLEKTVERKKKKDLEKKNRLK